MTLTQNETALLKTAVDAEASLFAWMHGDTTNISNTEYANIRAGFQNWQAAYAENNLYITLPGGGTQQLSGIDQLPIPPAR